MTEVGSCSREAGGREAWARASVGPDQGGASSGLELSVTLQLSSNTDWLLHRHETHLAHKRVMGGRNPIHTPSRSLTPRQCD